MAPSTRSIVATLLFCSLGCGGDDDGAGNGGNEDEVITTVILTFAPEGGGTALTFSFDDPDGDGGDPAMVEDIELAPGAYDLTAAFENRLEEPAENITEEIADEDDEHQVFFTGSAVNGPASDQGSAPLTHAYDDADDNGDPIGLANTITAAAGSGTMTVTLRHLPPVDGAPAKTSDLAATVLSSGFGAIGGDNDVNIDFDVSVQ